MSDNATILREIECTGCAARFRVRGPAGQPLAAGVDCPLCGAPIALNRSGDQSFAKLSHASVFGHQAPLPTAEPPRRKSAAPAPITEQAEAEPDLPKPRLGLFEARSAHHRSPEADRPNPMRPLAAALLRELRGKAPTPTADQPPPSPLTPPRAAPGGEDDLSALDEGWGEGWLGDALSDAADELFIVDDSPAPFERLPGADDAKPQASSPPPPIPTPPAPDADGDAEEIDDADIEEVDVAPGITMPSDAPAQEPRVTPAQEPRVAPAQEPRVTPEPLTTGDSRDDRAENRRSEASARPHAAPTSGTRDPFNIESILESALPSARRYSLKIGDAIYGNIDTSMLLALFQRGVWVIADAIAEDDGPFVPLEEHPIYEKVQASLTRGLHAMLLAHATRQSATPARADQLPAFQAEIAETPAPAERSLWSRISANHVLPWTVALVATGVASAAVTYAAFAPAAATTQSESVAYAPAVAVEPMLIDDFALERERQRRVHEAIEVAVDRVDEALEIAPDELAQAALSEGDHSLARRILTRAYAQAPTPGELQALFDQSLEVDPALYAPLETLEPSPEVALRALGGGRSVSLRLTEGGESRYAFKPAQFEWEDGWKAEIAAFRLCQILPCAFRVPENKHARLTREAFDELYGRVNTSRQRNYAEARFEDLRWVLERDERGQEQEFLHGVIKAWEPEIHQWPIEYTDVWQPLVDLNADPKLLEQPAPEFLQTLIDRDETGQARRLRGELGETSTREIARQLSNITVFDYLTNNFDRYSGVEEYYGVNNHFVDGTFLSLDNGAAFQFQPMAVVERRLPGVTRFSRTMIDAVRMMRPEVVDPILFPEQNNRDRLRLKVFWQQREKLLMHVDRLVAEHGEEAVYAFE
ncbi:hypothetical protein FRC98_19955 [Lujinxingia vulgaris]|uniref:Uncharacterized protein n=1 Tax=Lujinxingia vulgaris TaxID=2600176 RepID=A0A5C6WYZ0_9DELT|nr:hypothetical protein [Lujinxingia vulgaris]TXD33969.1 hypothetical protein FRC98_19955 [Lujinxingia vulgaris]